MPKAKDHDVFFVHIPKTGGSSIEKYFGMTISKRSKYFVDLKGREYALQHMPAKFLRDEDEFRNSWEQSVKFTVVRNPYYRTFSRYKQSHRERDGIFKIPQFNEWFDKFYKDINIDHKIPQYEFVYDDDGKLLVDEVLRFENLNNDFTDFLAKYKLPKGKLPVKRVGWLNVKHEKAWVKEIIEHRGEQIREMFKLDFEYFNYPTEG